MKIQIAEHNIANKGIYYTKSVPLFKENLKYPPNTVVKVSDLGARYIEESFTNIPKTTRNFITKKSVLSIFSKNMDIFIQYLGEKWNKSSKTYQAALRLYLLENSDDGEKKLNIVNLVESDENSPIVAKANLFDKFKR